MSNKLGSFIKRKTKYFWWVLAILFKDYFNSYDSKLSLINIIILGAFIESISLASFKEINSSIMKWIWWNKGYE